MLLDEGVERCEADFAPFTSDQASFRIDDAEAGPTVDAEFVPEHMVGVVDHRVLDAVAHDRVADVLLILLGVELGRVNADHHHVVGIGLLQLLELRQHVHAVDAAVGPEIEDHELAAERLEVDRPRHVQPARAPFERGREVRAGEWVGLHRVKRYRRNKCLRRAC